MLAYMNPNMNANEWIQQAHNTKLKLEMLCMS